MARTPLGIYAYDSAEQLAQRTGAPMRTVQRWRRTGFAPAMVVRLLQLQHAHELGKLNTTWSGWTLRSDNRLHAPDGNSYVPGEILAIQWRAGQIAALELERRQVASEIEQHQAALAAEQHQAALARSQRDAALAALAVLAREGWQVPPPPLQLDAIVIERLPPKVISATAELGREPRRRPKRIKRVSLLNAAGALDSYARTAESPGIPARPRRATPPTE